MTRPPPSILIVDDDADLLDALCRDLGPLGAITATLSSRHALELLRQGCFDVIISDLDMPGVDGHEVLQCARHHQPLAARVLITGAGDEAAAARAINEDAVQRYVRKPWNGRQLRESVSELLRQQDELARAHEARINAQRRSAVLSELQIVFPGIAAGCEASDAHPIDRERAIQDAEALGLTSLFQG